MTLISIHTRCTAIIFLTCINISSTSNKVQMTKSIIIIVDATPFAGFSFDLMTSCFKDDKECAGHLVFRFLITGSVNEKAEECNGH